MSLENTKKLICRNAFNCIRSFLAVVWLFVLITIGIFFQTDILEIVETVPVIGPMLLFIALFTLILPIMLLLLGRDLCKDNGDPYACRGRRSKKPR